MEMNQVEAFLSIAKHRGFSKAAIMLHLSQPAISRRIQLLEDELEAKLFERVHGGAVLTEAGTAFLPHARQILAAARDGFEAVKALEHGEQGTVKLAVVGTLAGTHLTDRLLHFRNLHPQVRLELQTARSHGVSTMVQSGEVHLGLRYFPDSNPKINSQLVEEESLTVVCGAHHHFVATESLLDQLGSMPCVNFPLGKGSSGEPFAKVIAHRLINAGLTDVETIAIDSLTAQKRLIEADFGFGLMPISSIQEELKLKTLQTLDIPELQTKVPVMALTRQNGYLSKAARSLLKDLVK